MEGTLYTGNEVKTWASFDFRASPDQSENIYVFQIENESEIWFRYGSTEHLDFLEELLN